MFSISGRAVRTCAGWTRRDWLQVGTLGTLGLSLPDLARAANLPPGASSDSTAGHASFGRAKACIVLFLFGAPAHQDTWDLKPDSPAEVRGEFQPIATSVPGVEISEHLPRLSSLADQFALLRSVTHPDDTHTVAMHYMLTGVRHKRPKTNPQNAEDDFPCFGALWQYLQRTERQRLLPATVSLNAPANQVSANNHIFPGFFAGLLGRAHDPLFISRSPHEPDFDPFPALSGARELLHRRQLLSELERHSRRIEHTRVAHSHDQHYQRAFDLLTSPAARTAFDLSREPAPLRARYGTTPFGQGCLLARRLVEAGVSLVTVNWERDDAYWDTHKNNFVDHREKLLPNLDRGFSALLEDLAERGLLDTTLVVCLGEFGRTPKINGNAGRDHWAACNTVVLAGGGVPGGQVYGASDRMAAYPLRDPVTPDDLAATIYHLLGIDPHRTFHDPEGRPWPVTTGAPLLRLL